MPKRSTSSVLAGGRVHKGEHRSPIPATCTQGAWQSGLAVDAPGKLLFSWIEGKASHRLGRWDLGAGRLEVTKPLGWLCDVLVSGDAMHVVTSAGLETFERGSLKKTGALRKQLPKHPSRIRAAGADRAIIGGYRSATSSLVSLGAHAFIAKLRLHAPDVVVPTRAGALCVGTTPVGKNGVVIGPDGAEVDKVKVPPTTDAIFHDDQVVACGDGEDGAEILFAFTPGERTKPRIIATLPEEDVVFRLLGIADGNVVVELEDEVAWVSIATGAVVARVEVKRTHRPASDNPIGALVLSDGRVVVPPDEPRGLFRSFVLA